MRKIDFVKRMLPRRTFTRTTSTMDKASAQSMQRFYLPIGKDGNSNRIRHVKPIRAGEATGVLAHLSLLSLAVVPVLVPLLVPLPRRLATMASTMKGPRWITGIPLHELPVLSLMIGCGRGRLTVDPKYFSMLFTLILGVCPLLVLFLCVCLLPRWCQHLPRTRTDRTLLRHRRPASPQGAEQVRPIMERRQQGLLPERLIQKAFLHQKGHAYPGLNSPCSTTPALRTVHENRQLLDGRDCLRQSLLLSHLLMSGSAVGVDSANTDHLRQ